MPIVSAGRHEWLVSRTPVVFQISGALLLVTATVFAVTMSTPVSSLETASGLPLVLGILLSFVAMVGLCFRLVGRTRLAHVGLLLLLAPFLVNLLLIFVYAPLTGTVPPAVEILISMLWGTIGVGAVVLGVGILHLDGFRPVLSFALFGWAVMWMGVGVAGFIYGAQHPAWVDFGISGIGGASLWVLGNGLREDHVQASQTERAEGAV